MQTTIKDTLMCGSQAPPDGVSSDSPHNVSSASVDNTLFASDEFRIYCMKVLPCSKRYSHDWPSCPFSHPGEKAKRRDPRTHQYDCEMCPAVVKGEVCELGAACPHSHHVFESWLHPQKYRTLLCKDGDQCHREVCFFAHGTKQLRTPDRGCYQRNNAPAASASQQQQHQQAAGPHGLSPAGQHSSSSNRPAPPAADSAAPGSTSYMQQQAAAAGSGSSFASSSSNTSSSTNVSSSTLAQMGRHGFPAAVGLAAGDGAAWQHADAGLATGGSTGAGLSHLVQSLVAQMTSSQQEAAESSRAAAEAQQKLQVLQQVLGRNLNACTPSGQTFAGAAPVAGGYGGTMPPTYEWQPTAALAAAAVARRQFNRPPMMQHNMPLQLQLQQQQHPQHGSGLDALYPRRHSVDETLLRRARNAAVGPGRPVGFGTPGASPVQQPAWAALPGGGVSRSGSGSASADIEALAAAFAGLHGAAGLPPADYGGLPPAGLVSDSVLLSPAAATGSQQLPGGGGHWQSPVQGVDATSMSGGALLPMGALCNIPQLNPPGSSQAVMHTNASLSAPQLQSDYLLQLHAMLQANAPVAGAVPAGSVRASFDMGATYLPAMSGGLVVRPFDLPGTDEATTATGNSRASHNCSVDTASVMVVVPDKLSANLIGGANDMGWF